MTPDAAVSPADLRFRLAALWVLAALLALTAVGEGFVIARSQPLGLDFLPMWTAARDVLAGRSDLYDFAAITGRQGWLIEARGVVRPFVYPPSALLLFAPFGLLPFGAAYPLWTLTTALLCAALIARFAPARPVLAAVLALVLSPCATVLLVGQTTFLITAMTLLAVVWLKARPIAAGVLLGLAAAIKPQVMVLAPLALIGGGHWRALLAAGVTGALTGLASLAAFGPQLWFDWLAALPRFSALVRDHEGLLPGALTPTGLAQQLGLDGLVLGAWRGAFALIGAALVVMTFRRTDDPARRLAALIGGGLMVTPYAIFYDAALFAPAAIWLALGSLDRPRWIGGFIGLLLLTVATLPWLGAIGALAFIALALSPVFLTGRRFSLS